MKKRNEFFWQARFLAGMGIFFLILDGWQVATSTVNPNRNIPFLMPIFFALMTYITLRIKWHAEGKDEEAA